MRDDPRMALDPDGPGTDDVPGPSSSNSVSGEVHGSVTRIGVVRGETRRRCRPRRPARPTCSALPAEAVRLLPTTPEALEAIIAEPAAVARPEDPLGGGPRGATPD
ncbi:MAG: hypothetical protein HOV94_08945 [Saccharothrix sp.]|nr:hypothetical protein [Saccharothrix sp.]